jgi:hypothetical protein
MYLYEPLVLLLQNIIPFHNICFFKGQHNLLHIPIPAWTDGGALWGM